MKEWIDDKANMEDILREETIGWLGMNSESGPYVIPLNYAYEDGRVVFHCAHEGLKLDLIRSNPEVCFSVGRQAGEIRRHADGVCHPDSESVLCFGRARILEDLPERASALTTFQRSFQPDAPPMSEEGAKGCGVVEIVIREMTGRRELDRKRTYWRHLF